MSLRLAYLSICLSQFYFMLFLLCNIRDASSHTNFGPLSRSNDGATLSRACSSMITSECSSCSCLRQRLVWPDVDFTRRLGGERVRASVSISQVLEYLQWRLNSQISRLLGPDLPWHSVTWRCFTCSYPYVICWSCRRNYSWSSYIGVSTSVSLHLVSVCFCWFR